MLFNSALPKLRQGLKIYRTSWPEGYHLILVKEEDDCKSPYSYIAIQYQDSEPFKTTLKTVDILATDWAIIR